MRDETVVTLMGFDSYELRLGDELRGDRASIGKSLLDVQRDLKIKAAYVDAIENCDASVFPNRGFVAGYVRTYARYLGREPETTFRRFCAESGFQGVSAELAGSVGRGATARVLPMTSAVDEGLARARFLPRAGRGVSAAALSGLGSVLVLLALIVGIGYGAWYVLRDIQRIDFAPVAQAPEVLGGIDIPAIPELAAAETASPGLPADQRSLALGTIYTPQFEAPRIEPRDGPIAAIDPDRIGRFAPGPARSIPAVIPPAAAASAMAVLPAAIADAVAAAPPAGPPDVAVFARDNAWIRIYLADGSIVFEKILNPGESYAVAPELAGPLLRAGNSGAVFLQVGGLVFGPLGKGSGVARDVSLAAADIAASWPRAAEVAPVTPAPEERAGLPAAE